MHLCDSNTCNLAPVSTVYGTMDKAEDKIKCLNITLSILRVYGIFPQKNKELNPGKAFFIKLAVIAVFCSLTMVGSFLHLIMSLKNGNKFYSVGEDVNNIISCILSYIMVGMFVYKIKVVAHLYTFLSNFSDFGKPTSFDKVNDRFSVLSKLHSLILELDIFSILLTSNVLKGDQCGKENVEYGLKEICGLVAYTWMPFDIDRFPAKQIYLSSQLVGMHYLYFATGTIAWMILETMNHIIVRIRHVKELFADALMEENVQSRREKFNFVVKYHTVVL
ncbi:hypothetical protein NQ317_012744, partial [Molorchus minor]